MERTICTNPMCSVYVFGPSAHVCPDCGNSGQTMTSEQDAEFMVFFRKINA